MSLAQNDQYLGINYKQSGLSNVKTFCSLLKRMCEFQAIKKGK